MNLLAGPRIHFARWRLGLAALALGLLLHGGAWAEEPLAKGGSGVVREVVDGDTLVLEDGTTVRLVGIMTPKLPLGRRGFPTEPLARDAKAALEDLTLGRRVTLSYGGRRTDRYGRALAHLRDEDGLWIQGELLRRGLARVYTFSDNTARSARMLALEDETRRAGGGVWTLDYYHVLTPEETGSAIGTFQLVEGRVVDAAKVRGRAYLNFGPDYRSDFTITISPKDMRTFRRAGVDPTAFEGRRVRVRGWLTSLNGPMIEVTHPEQIEVLEE
ncbi:MAG: thermonuclease family protein [Proteobacteria bacterium]|nr:thermonuclease family protein [Pseudomonadota bacterium]